jgi:hypothetical protein
MGVLLLLISYLFGNIAAIGSPGIFVYGAFVFLTVYSYTELMDGNRWSLALEAVKNAFGVGIIWYTGDWFRAAAHLPWITAVLVAWFIGSTLITAYFVFNRLPGETLAPVSH